MGLRQRRRPSPIQVWPTRVRRRGGEGKSESSEGPDSSDIPSSPDSPDSPESSDVDTPSPTESSFSTGLPPPLLQTATPSQVSSQASSTAAIQSDAASLLPPSPSPSGAQNDGSLYSESAPSAPSAQSASSISAPDPIPAITAVPTATTTKAISSTLSTFRRPVTPPPSGIDTPSPSSEIQPFTTTIPLLPSQFDQSELDGASSGIGKEHRHHGKILSRGAEAAAITLSIMGFVALVVGIIYFFKWRRKRQNETPVRHAEDAFSLNNHGSLLKPETAHLDHGYRYNKFHETKSSTNSASLFGGSHYQRPETVSTDSNTSRIRAVPSVAPPQPTPNPFADPPRNKAYDQLRGRPRSTTLTDRGSWVDNPFKDPASERFDPFGELQERAREERKRYLAEVRREAEEKRHMEREKEVEKEFAEKERYYR